MAWQPVYEYDFKSSCSKVLIKGGLGQLGTGLARFFFILSWYDLDMFRQGTSSQYQYCYLDLVICSDLELLKDFAPAPEGAAAAVSLFVSSTNSIQIVRRQCCLLCFPYCLILDIRWKWTKLWKIHISQQCEEGIFVSVICFPPGYNSSKNTMTVAFSSKYPPIRWYL